MDWRQGGREEWSLRDKIPSFKIGFLVHQKWFVGKRQEGNDERLKQLLSAFGAEGI